MTTDTITIKRIPLEDLVPNPDNPRRITDKHASLPSLAQSLKEMGQVQPIVVRPIETQTDEITGYQIVAGERRWRAAKLAGLEEIECIVRQLDDQQAFSICVVENLQREDLHWLEEARGIAAMTEKGWSVETIAKEIGKSVAWVHLRGRLSEISPKWQKAVEDSTHWAHKWPAVMLEQIARFPKPAQDEILAARNWELEEGRISTAAELKAFLEKGYLRLLKSAPWDLNDGKLVMKAGACNSCGKRSSCQATLFDTVPGGGDRCLDSSCWDDKQHANTKQRIADLKASDEKVAVVFEGGSSGDDLKLLGLKSEEVTSAYLFAPAKKDEKGAKKVLVIKDNGSSQVQWMKPARSSTGSARPAAKKEMLPPKEQIARLNQRRGAFIGTKLGDALEVQKDSPFDDDMDMVRLIAAFGADHSWSDDEDAIKVYVKFSNGSPWAQALWDRVRVRLDDALSLTRGSATMESVVWLCELLDWRENLNCWLAEARKEIPTPQALLHVAGEDAEPEDLVVEPVAKKTKSKAAKA